MKKFEQSVSFEYDENEYTIKANKMMGAIRVLSGVVGVTQLSAPQDYMSNISDGICELVNYCGGKVTAEEVYCNFIEDIAKFGEATGTLMSIIMPLAIPPKELQKYSPKKSTAKTKAKKTTKKKT